MDALDRALDALVDDGTLTPAQASAVRARHQAEQGSRRPRVAEAVGYLGGTLALVSALVLASQFWADLRVGAQVALLVLTAVTLLAGGRWARGERDSGVGRLAGLLWALSVAAIGAAAWVAVDGRSGTEESWAWLAAGGAALVWGVPLWRARVGALQQLPVLAGALVTVLAGLDLLASGVPGDWAGLVVWVAGGMWAVLAWGGWIRPARTGLVLGALTALAGAQTLAFSSRGPGLTIGALTVLALLGAAAPVAQPVMLGLGTAGAAVFLPQILDAAFPDELSGPALTFVTGVVLLAGGLTTLRTARQGARDDH